MLRWAGCTDLDVAVGLGADVPFCLVGGRARVEGVGEKVTPLPFEARDYLLLLPPFGVETARVYRAWDEDPRWDGPNALAAAALAVEPRLGRGATPSASGPGASRCWPGAARRGSSRAGWRTGKWCPTSCASTPRRPGWCTPARCRRAGKGTEGRAGAGRRKLLAGPALPPGGLQHLLVLLLAHTLATLFDQ